MTNNSQTIHDKPSLEMFHKAGRNPWAIIGVLLSFKTMLHRSSVSQLSHKQCHCAQVYLNSHISNAVVQKIKAPLEFLESTRYSLGHRRVKDENNTQQN